MIILGTPNVRLFVDNEITLMFICIVLAYTTLYFYYLSHNLKNKIKGLESEIDDHSGYWESPNNSNEGDEEYTSKKELD
jgi:hypothetical protein